MNRSYEVIKSSIDHLAYGVAKQVADEVGSKVNVAELEDVAEFDTVLRNAAAAVVYQVTRVDASPRAPKYSVSFNIGAKTTDDGANLAMTRIIALLAEVCQQGARIELRDYTGEVVSERVFGAMQLIDSIVTPQQFDKQSGIRMITCSGKAVCLE